MGVQAEACNVCDDGAGQGQTRGKGFQQRNGIDFSEMFVPVVKISGTHLLLAKVFQLDFFIDQVNIKNAFLNDDLDEEVFMEQPEGFVDNCCSNSVCRLEETLYGLKQAFRPF